jgi:branched-chain amino acid transport system substrate-binding protein
VIAAAIEATKTTDAVKLADYLHTGLKDFSGLTGKISFNEKGDRVGDLYRVYKVDAEGKFVLQQ